jgi:hypothetical protein
LSQADLQRNSKNQEAGETKRKTIKHFQDLEFWIWIFQSEISSPSAVFKILSFLPPRNLLNSQYQLVKRFLYFACLQWHNPYAGGYFPNNNANRMNLIGGE